MILRHAGTDGPARQTPLSQSMCRHLLVDDAPLAVDDTRGDERWHDIGAVSRGELAAYAGTPLHAPGGQPLGVLCVIGDRPHIWEKAELETLGSLAVLAAAPSSPCACPLIHRHRHELCRHPQVKAPDR
ncbi:GAF domain-containing protein [Planomonospora corallina]|uniref:GAF domain-containing protein n=1 Tax=Planomonospora corallina TaxID=1806052 RepID=A0ABV8I450_9ACTN